MVEIVLKFRWKTHGTSTIFPWWNTRGFQGMLCLGKWQDISAAHCRLGVGYATDHNGHVPCG